MFKKNDGLETALTTVKENLAACSSFMGMLGLKLCVDQRENGRGSLHVKTPKTGFFDYIKRVRYNGKELGSYHFSLNFGDKAINLFTGSSLMKGNVKHINGSPRRAFTFDAAVDAEGKIIKEGYQLSDSFADYTWNKWEFKNNKDSFSLMVEDQEKGRIEVSSSSGKDDDCLLRIVCQSKKNDSGYILIKRSKEDGAYHVSIDNQDVLPPCSLEQARAIVQSLLASPDVQDIKDQIVREFAEFIINPDLIFGTEGLFFKESKTSAVCDAVLPAECCAIQKEVHDMIEQVKGKKITFPQISKYHSTFA